MIESVLAQEPAAGLSLLATFVLIAVYFYLYHIPTSMPGLGWFAAGLALVGLRMIVLLNPDHMPAALYRFLLETLHSGSMVIFLGGALVAVERKVPPLPLVGLWALTAAWSLFADPADMSYYLRTVPPSFLVGGVAIATGLVLHGGGRQKDNPGLVFAGWAFVLWGVHRMDYPWTLAADLTAPWVFRLTMAFSLAFSLSMIVAAFHHTEHRLRRSERLLREGVRQFETIVLSSPVPMLAIDPDTRQVLFSNPPADARFPLRTSKSAPASAGAMFDSATGARFLQMVKEDRHIEAFESRLRTNDDTPCWAVLNSVPLDYAGTDAALITAHDITDRKEAEDTLQRQATTDSLTDVFNRRHYLAVSEKELQRALRYDSPISVIVLDLDHFKDINDTHGHLAGDIVLKTFARTCLSPLRTNDVLGRIGGEEFAITLPEATCEAAHEVAERLRRSFAETAIDIGEESVHCTLSAGVTERKPGDTTINDLLKRADRALYDAKDAGRNKVKMT